MIAREKTDDWVLAEMVDSTLIEFVASTAATETIKTITFHIFIFGARWETLDLAWQDRVERKEKKIKNMLKSN